MWTEEDASMNKNISKWWMRQKQPTGISDTVTFGFPPTEMSIESSRTVFWSRHDQMKYSVRMEKYILKFDLIYFLNIH